MARRFTNCAFTYLLGHIVIKGKKNLWERVLDALEPQPRKHICIHWIRRKMTKVSFGSFFDIHHRKLFTVDDLWRNHATLKEDKQISKTLSDKIMYIGTMTGCKKISDIYAKHGRPCKVARSCQSSQSLSNESTERLSETTILNAPYSP